MQTIMSGLRIILQSRINAELVEPLRNIYSTSFPPSEQIDFAEIARGVAKGSRWLFTVQIKEELVGFAITSPLVGIDIQLLEYMAVADRVRNNGIGSVLLRYVSDTLQVGGLTSGVLIEVEPENEGTPEERKLRKRRIQFYCRNGACLVECAPHYRMPNQAGEGGIPMKLMWLPSGGAVDAPSGHRLRHCIIAIYGQVYGRSTDDPVLQSTLSDLTC